MLKNKFLLFLIIAMASSLLSGCSISFKTKEGGNDGGVYVTFNKGDSWQRRILIPTTSGAPGNIAGLSNRTIEMDPSDHQALYFASVDNGLYYSYNQGLDWRLAEGLGKSTVNDVSIDPKSKCTIYAAIGNKVYQSVDCNRTWSQVYYDNDPNVSIKAIEVDHYDNNNVYIGTSRGEVIKSMDKGLSWKTLERFENSVNRIVMSPFDSRILFLATQDKGLFRTFNSGDKWESLQENLKEFSNSNSIRDVVFSESEVGLLFMATNYGLLKTYNHGDTWERIELVTPEAQSIINALAVSPQNAQEIYYVTNTTFYRSADGGVTWTTKKLPTTRAGQDLLIDPENTRMIYLTTLLIKK